MATTAPSAIPGIVQQLRSSFNSNITLPKEWRLEQLQKLQKMINDGREKLSEAMYKDLHRSRFESHLIELNVIDHEIQYALDNFDSWVVDETKPTNFLNFPAKSVVHRDPLGVVLIMSPWNYPVQLLLVPLIGALAGGNTVLLRPAEYTSHTSNAIKDLVAKYFDPKVVTVITGGRDVNVAVLAERFDYIFFTGGTTLGRIVHAAANKHLTPVTLELGGKSPTYVDSTADLEIAAKRIVWGSFLNAGQTCVRPDYLMVQKEVASKLVALLRASIREFYLSPHTDASEYAIAKAVQPVKVGGSAPLASAKDSCYFARIVDGGNAIDRIAGILKEDAKFVVEGGDVDMAARYVAPTLLDFADDRKAFDASASMRNEIFGPLLPILTVKDAAEAISIIRAREKPLAMYIYTTNSAIQRKFADETSSGSLLFNDSVVHLANHALPFGGVGNSGMGAYHGKQTFETFTHAKAVMYRKYILDMPARYPPYTSFKRGLIHTLGVAPPKRQLQLITFILVAAAFYLARNPIQMGVEKVLPYALKVLPGIAGLLAALRFF